jgi:hypothetical protein
MSYWSLAYIGEHQETLAQGLQSISILNERPNAKEQMELKGLETHLYLNLATPPAKVLLNRTSLKDVSIAPTNSYTEDIHPMGRFCLQRALSWFPAKVKGWEKQQRYNKRYPILYIFSSIFDRIEICGDKSCPVG